MINTVETAKYYAIFYFAAFTIAFLIKLMEGKRRKFPWILWLSLCIFSHAVFIIGTKAITLSGVDWQSILQTHQLPNTLQRSVLGGILSFVLVFFIARYFLKFKNDFLDAIAIPSAIGLAVQRIGCFMGGCCFGTTTNVPWAVQYDSHSPAYLCQLDSGLINSSYENSLPVHPTQLYYTVVGLLIVGLLLLLRNKIRKSGNLFLLSLSLYTLSRFIIEFFVDIHGNQIAANPVFGLKVVQWVLLIISVGIFILFALRERNERLIASIKTELTENYPKSILLILISYILIFYCQNWFSIMELHLLKTMLLLTIVLVGIKIYTIYSRPIIRVLHLSVFFSMLLLMSQTLDTTGRGDSIKFIRFTNIGIEQSLGKYESSSHEICNNTHYKHNIGLTNISYSNERIQTNIPYKRRELGANLYIGIDNVHSYNNYTNTGNYNSINKIRDVFCIGLNPYLSYNWQYFGFTSGLLISNYANFPVLDFPVVPQVCLRAGPENLFYIKSNMYPNSITGAELPIYSFIGGTGFGQYNKNYLELGLGASEFANAVFILNGTFFITDNIKLKSSIIYGNDFNNSGSVGLIYRFNHK